MLLPSNARASTDRYVGRKRLRAGDDRDSTSQTDLVKWRKSLQEAEGKKLEIHAPKLICLTRAVEFCWARFDTPWDIIC